MCDESYPLRLLRKTILVSDNTIPTNMGERDTEVVKKINPYMLEDPMYNYMLRKKEREKKERIDQLKSLLDESSSSSDDEMERGTVKKKKKKHKLKKKKKSHKKEKKSKKKRKRRKSSSSSSSSSSPGNSSSSSDEEEINSKHKSNDSRNKYLKKTSKSEKDDSSHKKKHKVKHKKRRTSISSHSEGSFDRDAKRKTSTLKHSKENNVENKEKSRTPKSHSIEIYDGKKYDRTATYENRDYRRRDHQRYHQSRRSAERRQKSFNGEKQRQPSSENTADGLSEVDRLIAKERARLRDEMKGEKLDEIDSKETENRLTSKTTWDAYIDNLVHQSEDESGNPHISRAGIVALDGGVRWTSKSHPKAVVPTTDESEFIAECFEEKDFQRLKDNGFKVEGVQYNFVGRDNKQFKTALGANEGSGTITLHASKTAIIIAHSTLNQDQGNAYKGTKIIAEYLESMDL